MGLNHTLSHASLVHCIVQVSKFAVSCVSSRFLDVDERVMLNVDLVRMAVEYVLTFTEVLLSFVVVAVVEFHRCDRRLL